MRINHNTTALNAWRNLSGTNSSLSKSLEKLSSGYRINRAADDPAGLVISEMLRAEIAGVGQAVNNTEDAVSMIQVTEGALVEINTLLTSMRSLALHAANTGASSDSAIAADQEQVDSAVNSIASIAANTAYLGRYLLNGDSGNIGTVVNATAVTGITIGASVLSGTTFLDVSVSALATKASAIASGEITSGSTVQSGTVIINGISVALASNMTTASAVGAMQSALTAAGVSITVSFSACQFHFNHAQYGDSYSIAVQDSSGVLASTVASAGTTVVYGTNVSGSIHGSSATGSGLTLTAITGTDFAGTAITMASTITATDYTNAAQVESNAISFQIGPTAAERETVSLRDVDPSKIGISVSGAETLGLNAIKAGAIYNLTDDPMNALAVIDAAIDDISTVRADLGALQKNVLETKVRSLEVSRENLTASESRIRDTDMAKEMTEFTRNQIMIQAGTAMLAQANAVPQSVLQLLQ